MDANTATLGLRLRPAWRPAPLPLASGWLAAAPALAALAGGLLPIEAVDPYWSLLLGGQPPGAPDPIVFTPHQALPANPQWLGLLLLRQTYELGSFGLLAALRGAVLALTVALMQLVAIRSGASGFQAAVAGLCGLPLIVTGAAIRPQLLVLPLFPLVLLLGGLLARRRLAWPAMGLISALWANLHGSFVLAPLVLGLLSVGAPRPLLARRLGLALVALAAALLNPWGPGLFAAVATVGAANAGGGAGGYALEWQPLRLSSIVGALYLVLAALALLPLTRLSWRERAGGLALLLPLGLMPFLGARHVTWFALTAAPLASAGLPLGLAAERKRSLLASIFLAGCLALAAVGLVRPLTLEVAPLAAGTPVAAADRLAEVGARRIFADSGWGAYLAWRLQPRGRVYIDNRFEQFGPATWASYRQIALAEPGWEALLDEVRVDTLALSWAGQPRLIEAAASSGIWQQVFADQQAVIFQRSGI